MGIFQMGVFWWVLCQISWILFTFYLVRKIRKLEKDIAEKEKKIDKLVISRDICMRDRD